MVGINITIPWADAVGHNHSLEGSQDGPDDGGITGPVIAYPDKRLNDASALDLMVVLPDDGLLTADIESPQHVFQGLPHIGGLGKIRLRINAPLPFRVQLHLGNPIVEKIHLQIGDGPVTV